MVLPIVGHPTVMQVEMNHFENVGVGERAQTRIPNGPTYEWLMIETNLKKTEIESVVLDMGGAFNMGETISVLGTDLVEMHDYSGLKDVYNLTAASYRYLIHLSSMEAVTAAGQLFSGLVTLTTDNNMLYVKVASGAQPKKADDSVDTPRLKLKAWASPSRAVRKVLPIIKSQNVQNNVTGKFDHLNLPASSGLWYRRLHMHGDIKEVEIIKDDIRKFISEKTDNEVSQILADRVPQSGVFTVDFVREGYVFRDMFNPRHAKQLVVRMQMGTAENIRILYEAVQELAKWQTASGELNPS